MGSNTLIIRKIPFYLPGRMFWGSCCASSGNEKRIYIEKSWAVCFEEQILIALTEEDELTYPQ
jgi:hypothetical protein